MVTYLRSGSLFTQIDCNHFTPLIVHVSSVLVGVALFIPLFAMDLGKGAPFH